MADDKQPRPFDALGPPSDPINFPRPQLIRGRRDNVLCFNPETRQHEVVENVLLRDPQRHGAVKFAYWRNPYREHINTIMGHVEICRVLERSTTRKEEEEDDDDDSEIEEDDDDIVFQWTTRHVAVKVNYATRMDQLRDRHAENPLFEIAAMQLLGQDPVNVLGAIEVLFDGQNLNVVMRYCGSGDLFQLLEDHQSRPEVSLRTPGLPEGLARYWFRQLMQGVAFVHSRGICHRDLSPENVMIDGNDGLIIDMGMCLRMPYIDPNGDGTTHIQASNGLTQRCLLKPQGACGKMPYMSPEVYANKNPFDGEAIDVWTCGTILFCMVTGNRSYQRPHLSDPQFYWMSQGLRRLLSDWDVELSEEGITLLEGMLQVDPRLRLTVEEVRNHIWFDQPDDQPMQFER